MNSYDDYPPARAERDRLKERLKWHDAVVAWNGRIKKALENIINILGPEPPKCSHGCEGCVAEMTEALSEARVALGLDGPPTRDIIQSSQEKRIDQDDGCICEEDNKLTQSLCRVHGRSTE